MVLGALHERMAEVGLELHPDKTRIVYCKDSNRRGSAEHTSFTFLGFTFRPRGARREDGVQFTSFQRCRHCPSSIPPSARGLMPVEQRQHAQILRPPG
jgi:hypothetical protein